MTDTSADVVITVARLRREEGLMVMFEGRTGDDWWAFAVEKDAAESILDALAVGESPEVQVPRGPFRVPLGCPEWCGYDDIHDEERWDRLTASIRETTGGQGG